MPAMKAISRLSVADAMRDKVVTISPDRTLADAARIMRDEGVTALAVVSPEMGNPGIITERDIGRALTDDGDPRDRLIEDFLTADVVTATPDWELARAARTLAHSSFRHLLVVDGGRPIGILSTRDIVRAWVREEEAPSRELPETGEMAALTAAHSYLYSVRRTAKQHLVAAKCTCQLEWLEVLEGQVEDRPSLTEEMLRHMWERRMPCPALHAEGGGAD